MSTPTVFVGRALAGNRVQVTDRWSGSRGLDAIAAALDGLLGKAN
jgi:hypothetical protein